MQMLSESAIKTQKPIDAQGRKQERYRQSHGIDCKQKHTFGNRALRGSQRQDSGQNGADAGRPAESKSEADEERAPDTVAAATATYIVHASIGVQKLDLDQPSQVQTEDDDDDTSDTQKNALIAPYQMPDSSGRRTQQNEHDSEAGDEEYGVQHHRGEQSLLFAARSQLFDAATGDQRHV